MSPLPSPVPFRGLTTAFATIAALLAVMWALQFWNLATGDSLLQHGITPRDTGELWPDLFTAQFLHTGFPHLIANTLGLAVLGFLAATRGAGRFAWVSLVIMVVGGLGIWLASPSGSITVGASGLVFGYFGYLLVRGFFDRRIRDVLLAFVLTAIFGWSMLWGALPTASGVSWQAHLGGFAGGVAAAYLFRRRPDAPARPSGGTPRAAAAGPRPLSEELKDLGLL
ncbi:rhomboid family intramembrane serine protease [Yinghuangia soli]|uniref:Rhomboid family intramembrane serine protease n=1 Tax=Yinghuangia soli TaxID=2908204 RepID=A0AA41Q0X5_9ACTN|nr:rhomboid family intramembrane serine protease [Yinghuangia soli]MCF2529523.1 rhomboid family intramembrane serine protease [Yinghuangia soli]